MSQQLPYPTTWKLINGNWHLRFFEEVYTYNGISATIAVQDSVFYLTVTVPKHIAYQNNYFCITGSLTDAQTLGNALVRSLLRREPRVIQVAILTRYAQQA